MRNQLLMLMVVAGVAGSVLAQGLPRSRATPAGQRMPNAAAANAATAASDDPSTLNWEGAPVDVVLQVYGERVKKTILKDPNCPNATITLKSRAGQKLTDEEYLEAIETILEMNQIHLEPYGESFIRALPRKEVRKEGIPLILDAEAKLNDSGRVVSMMIPFKNIGTEEAQKALEGFKSNSGILLVFERTNSILVTDTEQNINRMLEIAKLIDVATPVLENVYVRQIKYASAAEIMEAIQKIVEESMKEQEKDGKVTQTQRQPERPTSRLLGRNRKEPETPANNESLVMTVSDADRGMIRGKVTIVPNERSNKLIFVTQRANMDFFDKVIEALDVETTPDTVVKVYRLKYADSEDVSNMINDLIGNSSASKNSGKANQNQNSKQGSGGNLTRDNSANKTKAPANQRTGEAKAGELTKDNTTVLSDKRINGIVVMTNKELVPTIEQIIESMDIKLSQVLIETAIIEVTLGDDLKTGVDWVRNGRFVSDDPEVGLVKNKLWNGDDAYKSMLGGGGGDGANTLNTILGTVTNAEDAAKLLTPAGSGINLFLKSDALNLSAIIQASKSDSHAKYIASPVVMTVDNKEANIEATESRKFYSGSSSSGNGGYYSSTTYNYSDKDIGIKIKVTPKINPNGTVMLEVEEEYSQLGAGQTVLVSGDNGVPSKETIDTALSRKMSADILLDNMQTVVLGGLTETYTSEKETGIPILKDIPFVGKWLFGSVNQTESRKELLVFMTPYVLNDAEAAQAEALRRKRAISDVRAWDDHGWSASNLADPVAKKEQLRRFKEEWKKQDEERQTKLAIEKAKVERAKKLQALSKEERDLWLKMHKEELEAEQREELEEKMLDDQSQEELKKLAAEIRTKKLGAAEAELKAGEEAVRAENERARLDAEKKAGEQVE